MKQLRFGVRRLIRDGQRPRPAGDPAEPLNKLRPDERIEAAG